MFTLSNFYKSKQWEAFRLQMMEERVHDDGLIYCEHCRKPIVHKYDLIVHHKTELTNSNVNDYSISLNSDNVMLVHHKCHNAIHDRFGANGSRKVYIVYGAPLSGKSSFVHSVARPTDLIVDVDALWQALTINDKYVKPQRLIRNVLGVRDYLIEQIQTRTGKWTNAYIIGGYPEQSERQRLMDKLGAELIYIEATQEECMDRLYLDTSGRDKNQWQEFIADWFERYC